MLERIGTTEAKALLGAWKVQTHDPRLATEAGLALARLP
jgi:hypothetical protein